MPKLNMCGPLLAEVCEAPAGAEAELLDMPAAPDAPVVPACVPATAPTAADFAGGSAWTATAVAVANTARLAETTIQCGRPPRRMGMAAEYMSS
jgi:hypothetical protein